ncbi:MAG: ROK family protein, partial [Paludibacteraceae bacterium]|nr:ROK family protein [Paludibacteraceae bacterium]
MEKPYVLGLDLGGTNSVLGIVDARGHVIARTSIKTQQYTDINDYVEALYAEAIKIIEPVGGMDVIRGLGAGAPNGNYYTGNIEFAPNLPWKGIVPFAQLLSEKFGVPCTVTNDANAAAMGEMMYGAARGMKNFIMITLGTGVGSGIIIDGKMV